MSTFLIIFRAKSRPPEVSDAVRNEREDRFQARLGCGWKSAFELPGWRSGQADEGRATRAGWPARVAVGQTGVAGLGRDARVIC